MALEFREERTLGEGGKVGEDGEKVVWRSFEDEGDGGKGSRGEGERGELGGGTETEASKAEREGNDVGCGGRCEGGRVSKAREGSDDRLGKM